MQATEGPAAAPPTFSATAVRVMPSAVVGLAGVWVKLEITRSGCCWPQPPEPAATMRIGCAAVLSVSLVSVTVSNSSTIAPM